MAAFDNWLCFEGYPGETAANSGPVGAPSGQSKFSFVGDVVLGAEGSFNWTAPSSDPSGQAFNVSVGWIGGGGPTGSGPDYGIAVSVHWNGSGANFLSALFGPFVTPVGSALHFEIDIDTQAGACVAYENGTSLTRYSFVPGSPHFNMAVPTALNFSYGSALTDATFACANNIGLYVGTSTPTGAPWVYLTIPTSGGTPSDFFTNIEGTAGPFNFGGLTPHFCSYCAGGTTTPPPPSSSLAMDNVLAIDETPALVAGSQIFLDWSDDRGHSFGSPVGQPIGATGAYLTNVQWQRLSYGRDRVFRLTWSVPVATALQGAWIEVNTSAKS